MNFPEIIPVIGKPMSDAPRDGTLIVLMDKDVGAFGMRWGHIQKNGLFPGRVGMWTAPDGSMTWQDSEEEGPSHWCAIEEWKALRAASAIEARSAETTGSARQGESAVPDRADATPSPSQSESSHDSI